MIHRTWVENLIIWLLNYLEGPPGSADEKQGAYICFGIIFAGLIWYCYILGRNWENWKKVLKFLAWFLFIGLIFIAYDDWLSRDCYRTLGVRDDVRRSNLFFQH